MRIYPGRGLGGTYRSYEAHSNLPGTRQLGVGLWTGDGAPDSVIAHSDGTLELYPGNGPGGLTGGASIGRLKSRYDWLLTPGDLTGDGRTDLVGRGHVSGRLYLFPGGTGGFGKRRAITGSMERFDLAG